jgi:hypothetical protein
MKNSTKPILLVICYPLDWHWALSIEYLNYELQGKSQIEVLDASFAGEKNLRNLLKKFFGGSKLQKETKKKWKSYGIKNVKSYKTKWLYQDRQILLKGKCGLLDSTIAGPTFNSIVEKTGSLNVEIEKNIKIIRNEICAYKSMQAILTAIDISNYSKVVTVNGRFTKNATVVEWARKQMIKTELVEFGASPKKLEVFEKSPHSISEIESKIQRLWISSNSEERLKLGNKFLNDLLNFSGNSLIDWRKAMVLGKSPVKGKKKICTFFASTEAEYAGGIGDIIPDNNFKNQLEAFRALVRSLDDEVWDIYLRRHPVNPKSTVRDPEAFLWKEFDNSKIIVVDPFSDIDSISLGEKSDLIANFSSIIAMELFARGKQNVITLGPAPWNQLLPSKFLPNHQKLIKYLKSEPIDTEIASILPWAYYMSTHGKDFKLLKFNNQKPKWSY